MTPISSEELREGLIADLLQLSDDCYGGEGVCAEAAAYISTASQRIAEYRARLEIDHCYQLVDGEMARVELAEDTIPDGIECRDETIRLLEDRNARLSQRIAELEAKVLDLRKQRATADCRFTMGGVADFSGSHCPPDDPCQRCELERAQSEASRWKAEAEGARRVLEAVDRWFSPWSGQTVNQAEALADARAFLSQHSEGEK